MIIYLLSSLKRKKKYLLFYFYSLNILVTPMITAPLSRRKRLGNRKSVVFTSARATTEA